MDPASSQSCLYLKTLSLETLSIMYNYTKSLQTEAHIKTRVFVPLGLVNLRLVSECLLRLLHRHNL